MINTDKINRETDYLVLRGGDKQQLFFDALDRTFFINLLKSEKAKVPCYLYAFCVTAKSIHLLLGKKDDFPLERFVQQVTNFYTSYYNRKYHKQGQLFVKDCKREPVKDDTNFMAATRYIHQNPVHAKVVEHAKEYKWSSYNAYTSDVLEFIDKAPLLILLGGKAGFIAFMGDSEKLNLISPQVSESEPNGSARLAKELERLCETWNNKIGTYMESLD